MRLLREAFVHNLYLKVLSLALAVALWTIFSEDQAETAEVFLDIQRPQDLELLNPPNPSISVRVVGPINKLKPLRNVRLELPVDLSRAKPGEMVYSFVGQRIRNLPSGVDVTAYSPSSLTLRFDERVTRTVPVKAHLDGDPAAGYFVSAVETSPDTVTLEGPKSELRTLRDVATEPIKVAGLKKTFEVRQPLAILGPFFRVRGADDVILVRIAIEPTIGHRSFEGVEVIVPETMGKYQLLPERAKVVLEGPHDALEAIKPSDVGIFLNEGTMPLAELHQPNILRYPPPADRKGLPFLTVSWPRVDAVSVKQISPDSFRFRLLNGHDSGPAPPVERRERRAGSGSQKP